MTMAMTQCCGTYLDIYGSHIYKIQEVMIEEKFVEQFEEVANPREFFLGFFLIKIF
jgi:hypothetical protein